VPDLSGIKALAQRLGPVTRDAPEGETKGDAGSLEDQRVRHGCHPVTIVIPKNSSQPKADFGGVEAENQNTMML
jgi:hypothetical protein